MTPLVEYLLSLNRAKGAGKLVRLGTFVLTIPAFPPGVTLHWNILPLYGSYASIEIWNRFSPSMVPGAFFCSAIYSGTTIQSGVVGETLTVDSNNYWIEVTNSNYMTFYSTNISSVGQFYEAISQFLLVDTEEDFEFLKEVVRNWGSFESIAGRINETNNILKQLVQLQGGQVLSPAPYPPIGGA